MVFTTTIGKDNHVLPVPACVHRNEAAVIEKTLRALPGLHPELSLWDNLFFESHLQGRTAQTQAHLKQLQTLFLQCAVQLNPDELKRTHPDKAQTEQLLIVWLGRTLIEQPDCLSIHLEDWPRLSSVTPSGFERAYLKTFPWRRIEWTSH